MKKIKYKISCRDKDGNNPSRIEKEGFMFDKEIADKTYCFGVDHRGNNSWFVSELSTGMLINTGNTKQNALEEFEKIIFKVKDILPERVTKLIKDMGVCNETVTTISKNPQTIKII